MALSGTIAAPETVGMTVGEVEVSEVGWALLGRRRRERRASPARSDRSGIPVLPRGSRGIGWPDRRSSKFAADRKRRSRYRPRFAWKRPSGRPFRGRSEDPCQGRYPALPRRRRAGPRTSVVAALDALR